MTIPEKLKIGAKVYGVEITNKLDLGNVNYSGEISYTDLVIRICPNAQAKMEADFLHEMIHGMLDHLGYLLKCSAFRAVVKSGGTRSRWRKSPTAARI